MDYDKLQEKTFVLTKTPLAGYTLSNLFLLLMQNNFRISFRYIPRFMYSTTVSSVMAPFRALERKKFDKKIVNTTIPLHPFFILGHWRSGTTYLHNMLSLDRNLGYFTTFQAYLPGVFLANEKLFKPLVASSIPETRPMDNVSMHADFPQEDQYAVGAFSPYSYYHGWCFPKNMDFYNRFVLMDDVSDFDIQRWKDVYLYLLKKVTLAVGGKRLVLKNQDNTAKVKLLLEMFPDAKFVLIQRDPYDLYYSMLKFMRMVIPLYCVQNPPLFDAVEDSMTDLYAKMFRKYLKERSLIPKGNLIEVKYEDFIREPMEIIQHIYSELNLDGFAASRAAFDTYLKSQKSLNGESYTVSDEAREKIDKRWGFIREAFNYS
ncbi:MAG: sulfotransferase [Thermoplasmata archaeon]|nr:sulfotransferase [Thermoplasmata archaeon]